MTTPTIPVIFRRWPAREGGGVIALFPTIPGTHNPGTCSSYEHLGQHGACDPAGVIAATRPAQPSEYRALRRELESAPYRYRLAVRRRLSRRDYEVRRDETREGS